MTRVIPKVVRVGVSNNFNCTKKEFEQLDTFAKKFSTIPFFINSNIRTPNLKRVNDHPYKVVITLNPEITVNRRLVNRLYGIASDHVAFTRIKYIPEDQKILDLISEVSETHNVVITLQRFRKASVAEQFVPNYRKHYVRDCAWLRLHGESLDAALALEGTNGKTFICDKNGMACDACGLCSNLSYGLDLPAYSLNLSSSGICPYNCPDCFAKSLQRLVMAWGNRPINFDHIVRNKKQAGDLKHIKINREKAGV